MLLSLQVPTKVLQKYRIVKVDAPEAGVSLFVVRMRPGAHSSAAAENPSVTVAATVAERDAAAGAKTHSGTEAEVAASQKSCRVSVHGSPPTKLSMTLSLFV